MFNQRENLNKRKSNMKRYLAIILFALTTFSYSQELELIFNENFSNNANKWGVDEDQKRFLEMKDGFYIFENYGTDNSWGTYKKIDFNLDEDFKIEASIKKISGIQNLGFGLCFGILDAKNFNSYTISGNGSYHVNKLENGDYFDFVKWTKSSAINTGDNAINKLSLVKTGNSISYYINDVFVTKVGFQPFFGQKYGFIINADQRIAIDYLRVYGSIKKATVTKSNIKDEGQAENRQAWEKCFKETRDIEGAIRLANIAIEKVKDSYSKALYIDTRATAYGLRNSYQKALEDFNEAIRICPRNSGTISFTGLVFFKRGLIKEAMFDNIGAALDFDKAKEIGPTRDYKTEDDPLITYFSDKINYSLPPILLVSDITFSTNVLNAEQTAKLNITIKNIGPGDARDIQVNLSGKLQGLNFPQSSTFPTIKSEGGVETISIDFVGDINLPTSEASIKIEVVEPNFKVKIRGKQLNFPTREFKKPELILAQNVLTENQSANPNKQIDINEMIDLKFAVQNIGQGNADNVNIEVGNNQKGVMFLGIVKGNELVRDNPNFSEIKSGDYETIIYRYFVNSEFAESELQFNIKTKERIGKYGFSELKSFPINKQIEEVGYIRTIAKTDNFNPKEVVIKDIPDFVVDVDTDIPVTITKQINTYALIIGNEDYKSKQTGLTIEQNVDFAENDAEVFALYCEKTLGIPDKQIKLLKNATTTEIKRGLNWINNLSKIENGNAKLIFYYSGHGLPDEQSKEAYIIPVDVSGTDLEYAVKMADVYKKLTEHPAKQVTVFLDACFSGGARNQGLLAMKGIKVRPKDDLITGNLVVFASSTGDESSAVYRDKQHGYFTYFLLKKLKETNGSIAYNNLGNYLIQSVSKETGLIGIIQTPQVNSSQQIGNKWEDWKLK